MYPVEVKSGQTIGSDFDRALKKFLKYAGSEAGLPALVYGGDNSHTMKGVKYVCWKDLPDYAVSSGG